MNDTPEDLPESERDKTTPTPQDGNDYAVCLATSNPSRDKSAVAFAVGLHAVVLIEDGDTLIEFRGHTG